MRRRREERKNTCAWERHGGGKLVRRGKKGKGEVFIWEAQKGRQSQRHSSKKLDGSARGSQCFRKGLVMT